MRLNLKHMLPVSASAELGTLTVICARACGLDTQDVHMARYRIKLARQTWHPERMDHISAGDLDIHGAARRNVQHAFGCNYLVLAIAKRPRPLPRSA